MSRQPGHRAVKLVLAMKKSFEVKEGLNMKVLFRVLLSMMVISTAVSAADKTDKEKSKQEERLQNSGTVMSEILNIPDNIPQDLLDKARCVVVIPSVLKAAFIVGGTYGRGTMVCRSGKSLSGAWGAPAMFVLEGGSVGFQIGGEATDFVLLIMNDHGANSLLHSKVKLGGDISAAAGPVGRTAEANTDAYLRSEILTYSRARGLFAGISLEGASLRPDDEGNDALYGRKVSASEIVLGPSPAIPSSAQQLVSLLEKVSPTSRAHN
jgi:lipid-binding SYLF domain-containing protein